MAGISYYSVVRPIIFALKILLLLSLVSCYGNSHPPRIGAAAPDFTLQDGKRAVILSQFRGQVVVLNFWATWCPPCVAETPSLVSLSRRFKEKGIVVLGVSVDVSGDAYQRFLKDHGIDYLTVRDPDRKSSNLYGTFKFPETYVIDRQGILRRKFIGQVEWSSAEIDDYLTKLSAS